MAKTRKKTAGAAPDADRPASQRAGGTSSARLDSERVAARAYERYLARGGVDRLAMDDWLEAEREVSESSGEGDT
ncbi:MAG: DUF2934 domain-containing protein [Acidobacteria bacterium]|nr:DUF2934 domain-containing protein [Acidobacteriota bacterium]MBA3887260.1 DUF2934 domain-containing protein [Acidobacteriota bacterium]